MRLITLAVALGVTAIITKAPSARTYSLKNRYEANYSATWTAINNLSAQFTPAQVTFLAGLTEMTVPASYPLPDDPSSGNNWATGERDFVNGAIDGWNSLIQKLQRNGLMST